MTTQPLLIGSDRILTDKTIDVIDPFTTGIVATVALGDERTLEQACDSAHAAFQQTRKLPAHRRSEILHAAAAGIEKRKQQFADLILAEAGKPITFAEAEVSRAIITFTAAAEEARRLDSPMLDAADAFAPGAGYHAEVRRFPVGVIYGLTPFNFPLNLVAHKVAPAIASGNTIIIKPSPRTPLTALLLGEVLLEAGIVPGQVNIVTCSNENATHLLKNDRVKHVSFTGSAPIGWKLREKPGRKQFTLELGGNAAVIVHDDADLAAAVPAIANSAFGYAGQSCISVQRVFVQRALLDDFRSKLLDQIRAKIHTGDPRKRETVNGPMIATPALQRVKEIIDAAVAGGAKIVCGGEIDGPCFQPTIIENAAPHFEVNSTEIFAPVMTLQPYDTFEQAINMVNDSLYGLQAGVYTNHIQRVRLAFATLEVGGVLINEVPSFRLDQLPYGGIKDSGLGREGIRCAIEAMTELKTQITRMPSV